MYQRDGKAAYKADLSNSLELDAYLGEPHKNYPTIHLAGTNGKGSTCHMIASILQEAGYKVGLYTSPHLKDFRERIKINGKPCSKDFVVSFIEQHKTYLETHKLSFFEMTVGMAFQYFKEEQIDIAVIETGLGGRLDSTNIITPIITGITTIDKDHTAILGNTLTKIAGEKAGIIKANIPVVIGEKRNFLRSRFRENALRKNAPFHIVDQRTKALASDLKGHYQKQNARLAVKMIELLNAQKFIQIPQNAVRTGLLNVARNTNLRGRYEILNLQPKVICDTAHNKAGIKLLLSQIKTEPYDKLHIVMGVVNDKEVGAVLDFMPTDAAFYISSPDIPRGMKTDVLSSFLTQKELTHHCYERIPLALQAAKDAAAPEDLILITGSTFVVAEVI